MHKNVWHKLLFNITTMDKLTNVIHGNWCADMAYSMCMCKVRISSAATSEFYHFEDPHIRILPEAKIM